jgi:hypothetical protein
MGFDQYHEPPEELPPATRSLGIGSMPEAAR